MDKRTNGRSHHLIAITDLDCAFGDVERFVPAMAMRWRPAAFFALLQEDFITLSGGTGCKHRDPLAHDVSGRGYVAGDSEKGAGSIFLSTTGGPHHALVWDTCVFLRLGECVSGHHFKGDEGFATFNPGLVSWGDSV
ncbi:hypothetical protein AU476_18365 [Cupriavidus sp. UYMSc13B]|nr:hypothetical protein AU476_18365 [Cupriavidus sp. UYMSc13B]